MAVPAEVPVVQFYAGDPLTIAFMFPNEDRTTKTFVSHVKETTASTSHVAFTVNCYLDSGNTWLVLSLTGDSSLSVLDGQTRQIALESVWDVEQLNGSVPELTLFQGTLVGQMDVTQ
jgi:hypothetical protein